MRAYATGELMAVAPIDYSRLVFAGIMGFLLFAELPDRYTLVGAAIIVGSTLYIAYRETYLSPCRARGTADRCAPGGRRCAATSFGRVRE